jgi:hypothetical protein
MKMIKRGLLFKICLFIFLSLYQNRINAQDKYSYARVSFNFVKEKQITVISDNEPNKVISLQKRLSSKEKIKILLQTVAQLNTEGWEVISVFEHKRTITYYLKKSTIKQ